MQTRFTVDVLNSVPLRFAAEARQLKIKLSDHECFSAGERSS
jgi:hypothetical protein